jgi:cytochrome c
VAEYTDAPTEPGVPPQTGSATVVLDPDPVAGLAG